MNFRPELAEKVMAGEKTVTRRLVSDNPRSPWSAKGCRFSVGQSVAVCPGRGKHAIGRVVVTAVHIEKIGNITEDEARREGFASIAEFMDAWRAINGPLSNGWDTVWRVEFAVKPDIEPLWRAEMREHGFSEPEITEIWDAGKRAGVAARNERQRSLSDAPSERSDATVRGQSV